MLCHAKITAHDDSSSWAVLIHGLFGSADNLNLLAKTLSSNINVIQIDLPDHGKSPHTTEFNFNTYCDMIIDTLHHYQIKTAHFVGHSLGGKMTMHIALTYPKIVTEVKKFEKFYIAEEYHQDYKENNPNNSYIWNVSVPRINKFKSKFSDILKKD